MPDKEFWERLKREVNEELYQREIDKVQAIRRERDLAYQQSVIDGKAAPVPASEQMRRRKLHLIEKALEEFGPSATITLHGKKMTRAEYIKSLLDNLDRLGRNYTFQRVTKPKGMEDVCWEEIKEPPVGGLANTYMVEDEYRFIHLGFFEIDGRTDGVKIVQSDVVDFWIGYYEDVNT